MAKKTPVKAKRTARNQRGSSQKNISQIIKNEIIGIVLIGLACLGIVIMYSPSGMLGTQLGYLLRLVAGNGSIAVFIALATIGMMVMGDNKRFLKGRILGIFLLVLSLLAVLHLGLGTQTDQMMTAAKAGQGGGMVGAVTALVLAKAFGVTGSYVILTVISLIGLLLTINKSLRQLGKNAAGYLQLAVFTAGSQVRDFFQVLAPEESAANSTGKRVTAAKRGDGKKERSGVSNVADRSLFTGRTDSAMTLMPDESEDRPSFEASSWQDAYEETPDLPERPVVKVAEGKTAQGEKTSSNSSPSTEDRSAPTRGQVTSTPLSRQRDLAKRDTSYKLPGTNLLNKPLKIKSARLNQHLTDSVKVLEETLASFGVVVKVTRVTQGPSITRFELQPAPGVKVSKITSLADDIALGLASSDVRIEAPIPGKSAIGVEVPNKEIMPVHFREVLETEEYCNLPGKLTLAIGKDVSGKAVVADLSKMPHLLIAGATGSGKSVCINSIICSILYKACPDEVKMLLIDPKMVELITYNNIPHLISPVVVDPQKAAGALKWMVTEMESRYELFAAAGVRDIVRYNFLAAEKQERKKETAPDSEPQAESKSSEEASASPIPFAGGPLPYVVIVIDELADLMMVAPNDVEDAICRLAQMARAAGIHLIVATQRPSVDVITGLIKANIPSRIAFAVSSQVDSRTILDMGGAEKLLGRGDMLCYLMGMSKPVRVQGCFLTDNEVKNIVDYWKNQATPEYTKIPEKIKQKLPAQQPEDALFYKAIKVIIETDTASVSFLQRRLKIGYTRAARLMDSLEEKGIVSKYDGARPREVLMSRAGFEQRFGKWEEF